MFHVSTMLPYSKENKQQVGVSPSPGNLDALPLVWEPWMPG